VAALSCLPRKLDQVNRSASYRGLHGRGVSLEERDARNKTAITSTQNDRGLLVVVMVGSTRLPALPESLESKETERSLDCVAARPEERDARKEGRHSVRDDRGLLVAVVFSE
jgi:hypothetical protein